MQDPEEVLSYWFGDLDDHYASGDRSSIWFSGGEEVDREIIERFGDTHAKACAGELDGWLAAPRSTLALVVVLDQFSRNICRGKPEAFAQDPVAQDIALRAVEQGQDAGLRFIERVFLYMPFMHAETIPLHRRGQALFDALVRACPEERSSSYANNADYMRRHTAIIERFGRYPHRNEVLGRTSTEDELAFLKEPGSSF